MTNRITTEDADLVAAINGRTGAELRPRGRAVAGMLGGAVFVDWPDGSPGVVTIFHGELEAAEDAARLLNELHDRGLPVPRHKLVVELGDQVAFVQERLPTEPPRALSPRRIAAMVEINDRFAGALADRPDVPGVEQWFRDESKDWPQISDHLADRDVRAAQVADEINRLTTDPASVEALAGPDLVHVDLSAANVLFDADDVATAVIDWNLGTFRGDRRVALIQARFDREWFVQRPDPTPDAMAAAHQLDQVLHARIRPATLRIHWAFWLRHQLSRACRRDDASALDWQLRLAADRLL